MHIQDDRFDQHLRQQHVQLADDVLDIDHVLLRGEHQQGVAALVRDDLCLAEHLDGLLLAVPRAAGTAGRR